MTPAISEFAKSLLNDTSANYGTIVDDKMLADLRLVMRATEEGWDRRRIKRELLKGASSRYAKRVVGISSP